MKMSDSNTNGNTEKKLTFSFSKIKKTVITTATKETTKQVFTAPLSIKKKRFDSSSEDDDQDKDLITIIENKKVKSIKTIEKKPVVIPLIPNDKSNISKDDLNAIQALINDSKKLNNNKEGNKREHDDSLVIDSHKKTPVNDSNTEDPNYEQINIEDFGIACLRGMGWSEKSGIGKTNKQITTTAQPELRPRGLGLGASLNPTKKLKSDDNDEKNKLSYVKGAYLKIIGGKYKGEYGQLMGFDDGLNRILVKIYSNDKIESLVMSNTELVTKDEYDKKR